MIQRYWRVGVFGLGLGFVLGAALFGILAATLALLAGLAAAVLASLRENRFRQD